jgi:hypothetical protein
MDTNIANLPIQINADNPGSVIRCDNDDAPRFFCHLLAKYEALASSRTARSLPFCSLSTLYSTFLGSNFFKLDMVELLRIDNASTDALGLVLDVEYFFSLFMAMMC